jgi:hypothetical protein
VGLRRFDHTAVGKRARKKERKGEKERERERERERGYFSPDTFQTSKAKTKMGEERTTASTATNGCSDNGVVSY